MTVRVIIIVGCFFRLSVAGCPPEQQLKPCTCKPDEIDNKKLVIACEGDQQINLKSIFQGLSNSLASNDRHFSMLTITNKKIKQLDQETTGLITFSEIRIDAPSITKIHLNAFKGCRKKTTKLTFGPVCVSYKNNRKPFDWFDLIASFPNLETLKIAAPNFNSIPKDAFKKLTKLKWLDFKINEVNRDPNYGGFENSLTIADYSFFSLNTLTTLHLAFNKISHISAKMLNFKNKNKKQMDVLLSSNHLKENSFDVDSLTHFKRPTQLVLNGNTIRFFNETIFRPFLDADKNNTIKTILLNCEDKRNKWWLDKRTSYYSRVIDPECGSGYRFEYTPDLGLTFSLDKLLTSSANVTSTNFKKTSKKKTKKAKSTKMKNEKKRN